MKRILESDILNRGLGGVVQTDSPPLALFSEREPQINLFQDQIKKPQKIQPSERFAKWKKKGCIPNGWRTFQNKSLRSCQWSDPCQQQSPQGTSWTFSTAPKTIDNIETVSTCTVLSFFKEREVNERKFIDLPTPQAPSGNVLLKDYKWIINQKKNFQFIIHLSKTIKTLKICTTFEKIFI